MNNPAGVAFMGAGFITYLHLLAIRDIPGLRLKAIASFSEATALHRARIFDVEPYTFSNARGMMQRDDIDIVFILSPNSLHAEHSLMAIEAGKHIVLEKPMTVTLSQADQVIDAAQSVGLNIAYAENQVFAPILIKMREVIATGAIGKITGATGVCGHAGPAFHGWFCNPQYSGGGVHMDLGPHALESVLYLIGKPPIKTVKSCALTETPDGGIDARAEAVLETEDGAELKIISSWLEPDDDFSYEVTGEKGRIKATLSPPPQFLTLFDADGNAENIEVPDQFDLRMNKYLGSSGYVGQLVHFERCFRNGETPSESALDGRNVLRILIAGYLSAAENRAVEISSAIPTDKTPVQIWLGD